VGCEGESEQGYARLLNHLLRDQGHWVHFEAVVLGRGAGDPITRLQRAAQEVRVRTERRSSFRCRAVLLDFDQISRDPVRQAEAEAFAQTHRIRIIWQDPCHEAILLRHLAGFDQSRPSTTTDAGDRLRRAWPEYRKGMTRQQLMQRIDRDGVARAAAVEPGLAAFLADVRTLRRVR
jgi:hypothetical protein